MWKAIFNTGRGTETRLYTGSEAEARKEAAAFARKTGFKLSKLTLVRK